LVVLKENEERIDLPCTLIIGATEQPDYFGFHSPDLEDFSCIERSAENCIYKARWGISGSTSRSVEQQGLPGPPFNLSSKIIIQNQEKWAVA